MKPSDRNLFLPSIVAFLPFYESLTEYIEAITVNRWPHGYAYGHDPETGQVAWLDELPPERSRLSSRPEVVICRAQEAPPDAEFLCSARPRDQKIRPIP